MRTRSTRSASRPPVGLHRLARTIAQQERATADADAWAYLSEEGAALVRIGRAEPAATRGDGGPGGDILGGVTSDEPADPVPRATGDGVEASSRRNVTIYDVARRAGVASSTVSRAFARPGRVNTETAARIRTAAAELGYRVNPVTGSLSTSATHMIALMISDITNPFYAELVSGAQIAASEADHTVVLVDARESNVLERETLERVLPAVDALIVGSSRMSDATLKLMAQQKPMVMLNRHLLGIPSVVTDNARGVRRALEHLVALGHDGVTYVAGPEASWADGARWRALRETGAELRMTTRRTGPVAPTVQGGCSAATSALDGLPTAVLAYNDLVAIGMMLAFSAAGVRVPQDVSIVGFDNIPSSGLVSPGLTTVAAPVRAMGSLAVTHALALLRGALPRNGEAAVVPTRLVVRGSTGRPRC